MSESWTALLSETGSLEVQAAAERLYAQDLRETVVFSMQTAVSLDAVGFALEGYSKPYVLTWCKDSRGVLPRNKNRLLDGKGSIASLTLILAYDVLKQRKVAVPEDAEGFMEAFFTRVEQYVVQNRSDRARAALLLERPLSPVIVIALSLAVAYWCAMQVSDPFLSADVFATCIEDCAEPVDTDAAIAVTLLVHSLLHDGFFCSTALYALLSYGVLSDELAKRLQTLADRMLDIPYVMAEYPRVEGASYSTELLLETLHYVARVSTQKGAKAAGKPRSQLQFVMTSPNVQVRDLAFLFGAVCTASEHQHSIVLKDLRSGSYIDAKNLVAALVE